LQYRESDDALLANVCIYMPGLLAEEEFHRTRWRFEEDVVRHLRAVRAGEDEGLRLGPSDLRAIALALLDDDPTISFACLLASADGSQRFGIHAIIACYSLGVHEMRLRCTFLIAGVALCASEHAGAQAQWEAQAQATIHSLVAQEICRELPEIANRSPSSFRPANSDFTFKLESTSKHITIFVDSDRIAQIAIPGSYDECLTTLEAFKTNAQWKEEISRIELRVRPGTAYVPPPPARILETGYEHLIKLGGEAYGYGLYSYILIPGQSSKSAAFLHEIFKVVPGIKDTAAARSQLNILYIPFREEKQPQWLMTQTEDRRIGMMYLNAFYDFRAARAILNQLCSPPADKIRELCSGDLSRGPFLFTYPEPASKSQPVAPPYLFVDLSDIHERAFPEFISAFRAQVKSDDLHGEARINTLRLKLLSIALTAADWTTPIQKAIADIAYSVLPDRAGKGKN
jgi:hypothetical protein